MTSARNYLTILNLPFRIPEGSRNSRTRIPIQAFQEIKGRMSSTRGNNRSKDHVFVDYCTIHHIRLMGFVPDEVGFASYHICLHVDFSPSILDTKNTPIPPAPHWILKMHNMSKVLEYITGVKTRFEDHNVVQRV